MLTVLFEDNHLLAVNKPAGLPTMGVAEGKPSLLSAAKEYVRDRYNKSGNVYLGTVSRLDAPVTGVVLFARTSKAAARLTKQFRERHVDKIYWALVEAPLAEPTGELTNWLRKDERHRRVHACKEGSPGAQEARLSYRTLRRLGETDLLQIHLVTGRKHQIRVQLAERGNPILGDRKYGSDCTFPAGIALHARRLVVKHPTRDEEILVEARLPKSWRRWISGKDEQDLGDSSTH